MISKKDKRKEKIISMIFNTLDSDHTGLTVSRTGLWPDRSSAELGLNEFKHTTTQENGIRKAINIIRRGERKKTGG